MLMMRTLEGAEKEEEEEEEERYSLCLESSNVGCHHGHWRMERVFESMCLQQHAALQQRCVCRGCACQWPRAAPCSCTPAPPSAQPSTTNSNNFAFPCLFARIAPCSSRSARATRLREPHILLPKLCSVHATEALLPSAAAHEGGVHAGVCAFACSGWRRQEGVRCRCRCRCGGERVAACRVCCRRRRC